MSKFKTVPLLNGNALVEKDREIKELDRRNGALRRQNDSLLKSQFELENRVRWLTERLGFETPDEAETQLKDGGLTLTQAQAGLESANERLEYLTEELHTRGLELQHLKTELSTSKSRTSELDRKIQMSDRRAEDVENDHSMHVATLQLQLHEKDNVIAKLQAFADTSRSAAASRQSFGKENNSPLKQRDLSSDGSVDGPIASASKSDASSVSFRLLQAQLIDLQERYDSLLRVYRDNVEHRSKENKEWREFKDSWAAKFAKIDDAIKRKKRKSMEADNEEGGGTSSKRRRSLPAPLTVGKGNPTMDNHSRAPSESRGHASSPGPNPMVLPDAQLQPTVPSHLAPDLLIARPDETQTDYPDEATSQRPPETQTQYEDEQHAFIVHRPQSVAPRPPLLDEARNLEDEENHYRAHLPPASRVLVPATSDPALDDEASPYRGTRRGSLAARPAPQNKHQADQTSIAVLNMISSQTSDVAESSPFIQSSMERHAHHPCVRTSNRQASTPKTRSELPVDGRRPRVAVPLSEPGARRRMNSRQADNDGSLDCKGKGRATSWLARVVTTAADVESPPERTEDVTASPSQSGYKSAAIIPRNPRAAPSTTSKQESVVLGKRKAPPAEGESDAPKLPGLPVDRDERAKYLRELNKLPPNDYLDGYKAFKGHGRYQRNIPPDGEQGINARYQIDKTKNNGVDFRYDEVVRDKGKRKQLHGGDCECCRDYYEAVGPLPPRLEPPLWKSPTPSPRKKRKIKAGRQPATTPSSQETPHVKAIQEHKQDVSRHRHMWVPTNTPPDYWHIGFPNTQQVADINRRADEMHKKKEKEIAREANKKDGRYKKRS